MQLIWNFLAIVALGSLYLGVKWLAVRGYREGLSFKKFLVEMAAVAVIVLIVELVF